MQPREDARGCFVEASAGTGKTHNLVTEIASAIERGVPVDRIAAVTFTHAAAGSMKVRVRQELERRKNQGQALRTLDRAFIGTIHSFCAHLLRQRPVEACVDPDFRELDDPNARALFDGVFREWLAARLNEPAPVLRRALAPEHVRAHGYEELPWISRHILPIARHSSKPTGRAAKHVF